MEVLSPSPNLVWTPRAALPDDELVQIPKVGTLCGLKEGKLRLLCVPMPENQHKPPVRSITIKRKGKRTGSRLINVTMLREYLFFLGQQQEREDAALLATMEGSQS